MNLEDKNLQVGINGHIKIKSFHNKMLANFLYQSF